MSQSSDNKLPTRTLAIGAGGGALVGILLGVVAANLIGGTVPWVPIGAGVGAGLGVILMSRRETANKS